MGHPTDQTHLIENWEKVTATQCRRDFVQLTGFVAQTHNQVHVPFISKVHFDVISSI